MTTMAHEARCLELHWCATVLPLTAPGSLQSYSRLCKDRMCSAADAACCPCCCCCIEYLLQGSAVKTSPTVALACSMPPTAQVAAASGVCQGHPALAASQKPQDKRPRAAQHGSGPDPRSAPGRGAVCWSSCPLRKPCHSWNPSRSPPTRQTCVISTTMQLAP